MTSPETAAKGDAGSAGMRSGVPAAASVSARTTIRRASSILKALSPDGFASASAASAARRKSARIGACAGQDRFGFAGAPGFQRQRRRARGAPRQSCRPRPAERPRPRRPRMRRRCVRGLSGNGHGPRNAPPRPAGAPRRSSRRAPACSRVPARLRAGDETFRAGSRAAPLCLRSRPQRRARPAGTQKSDGCVAMQLSLHPNMA